MSQGENQLDSSPSDSAHGADDLSLDDIAGMSLDGDEVDEEIDLGEAPEGEDDEAEERPAAKRKFKIGDDELDEDEVLAGYQRHADYTRKTMEIAEERRQVQAERQRIGAERDDRANVLDALIGSLHQELLGIDQTRMDSLLESDPKAYLRAKEHIQQKQALIQRAVQNRVALQQQATQEQARELADYAREQEQSLTDKIPQWRDTKRREADSREIAATLRTAGYADAEIGELYDARALVIARKAMLYDKLQATRGQKSAAAPQTAPIRPGAPSGTSQRAVAHKRAAEKYRANPNSIDALASLIGSS